MSNKLPASDPEKLLHNLLGSFSVLQETVIALIVASKAPEIVISLAIQNATQLRDQTINSELPEAYIASVDIEILNLKNLAARLRDEASS